MLPERYTYLEREPAPRILIEALRTYGIMEAAGAADSPEILAWAREIGIDDYEHDAEPWCSLACSVWAHRAGYAPPKSPLWALAWLDWGWPAVRPMLGDVLVFRRSGGGHVGLYVGEDATHYHVLGGNQGDAVTIRPLPRATWTVGMAFGFVTARRCPWKIHEPENVRPILLSEAGDPSPVRVV